MDLRYMVCHPTWQVAIAHEELLTLTGCPTLRDLRNMLTVQYASSVFSVTIFAREAYPNIYTPSKLFTYIE